MNKVKFQHFVPRFYLANFADSVGQIWTFDKMNSNRFKSRPEKIGGQTYFYDVPELDRQSEAGGNQVIEKFFGPHEGDAAAIIKGWLTSLETGRITITQEKKYTFSMFLALQHLRTPEHRKYIIQWAAALSGNVGRSSEDFSKEALPYITANSLLSDKMTVALTETFFNHIWIFQQNKTTIPFYTSDHPLALKPGLSGTWHSGSGVASRGIQIIYPISSSVVLHILEREHWKRFEAYEGGLSPVEYTEDHVKHDNSGQVAHSTRWVYCRDNDFDFADHMCNLYPESRDSDRQRITRS
jgi:hypothetical protein